MISPELLRRYSYFAAIGEETLKAMAMVSEEESCPADTRMFADGDPSDTVWVIEEGEVNIAYTLQTGELRTVDTLVAGELLGWTAMIEPYRRTSVATTRTPVRLIRIDAKPLRELCEKDSLLGHRLMGELVRMLAERLEGARVQLATVS
jgi:CRP-like cAMP-binding protein